MKKMMNKKSKGMARGGRTAMKSKGYAKGGKTKMRSKGMAKGGKMKMRSKGMAKGGAVGGKKGKAMTVAQLRAAAKKKGYKLVKA
jgi:hypothetical protein